MINAIDLRIGNLVFHNGEVVSITNINGDISNDKFEGIPLTKEWFIKLGFSGGTELFQYSFARTVSMYRDETNHLTGEKDRLSIDFDYDDGIFSISVTRESMEDGESKEILDCIYYKLFHIKYVHQVQNLYHTITGDELILK